jgi:hypothetical protein
MQQRDVHVTDVTEGGEHAELRSGEGADTEHLDAGGKLRPDLAAPERLDAFGQELGRSGAADASADLSPQLELPLHRRR